MSTKDFGCFFCHGKATSADAICPDCSRPINVAQYLLAAPINEYQPTRVLGRGFYGWTLLVTDELDQSFALKLIPEHRLVTKPLHEARALVRCSQPPHPNIARFVRRIPVKVEFDGQSFGVTGMVFDHVANAQPLREFIESPDITLGRADLVHVVSGIAWGLVRLDGVSLWHNDLHNDNILIRHVRDDEGATFRYQPVIIDFGSAAPIDTSKAEILERGDYYYLGKHVFALVAKFERDQERLTPTDRTLASHLRNLAHRMMDPDISRRTLDPKEIVKQVDGALRQSGGAQHRPAFQTMLRNRSVSLSRPLENSNALTLAPQDVPLLFRDALGWESQLAKSETVVVVGPRGCGKTMLLRYLSVTSQAWPRQDEESPAAVAARLSAIPFLGFFVSCIDLRTPFLRSSYKHLEETAPHVAEDFCREYLNLQIAAEAAGCLEWLREEGLASISAGDLSVVSDLLVELLNGGPPKTRGTSIDVAIEQLDRRIAGVSNFGRGGTYEPTAFCRDDALLLVAKAISEVSWTASKEIRFLIDDYSASVLPAFVQMAMNPIVFHPTAEMRIKLSSEGDGPELSDTHGRKYKEGRELTKVNRGELYLQADEERGRLFIEAILTLRCSLTDYGSVAKLKAVLGEHPDEEKFGDYIRAVAKKGRAGDARCFGFGLLCRLCSGDVSYVIEPLRAVVGDDWAEKDKIAVAQQDAIIKRFAIRQLQDLKRVNKYGPTLYQCASNVGAILRQYLLGSKEGSDERLRIEVEGDTILSHEALAVHQELLRHSVLVDGGFGKSRAGATTRKFFVRRLLAPCFPFSPARRGCIALKTERYEEWLRDPGQIRRVDDAWDSGLGAGE